MKKLIVLLISLTISGCFKSEAKEEVKQEIKSYSENITWSCRTYRPSLYNCGIDLLDCSSNGGFLYAREILCATNVVIQR